MKGDKTMSVKTIKLDCETFDFFWVGIVKLKDGLRISME